MKVLSSDGSAAGSAGKERAADRAYAAIRQGLIAGRWGALEHLRENDLSVELGMSRTPVRDALRRLAAEGLLTFEPHLGATVPNWSPDDLDEIFMLRAMLEGAAADLAASRATSAQVDELERLTDVMAAAAALDGGIDLGAVAAANQTFHRLVIEASDSPRLGRLIGLITELALVVNTFARYDERAMRRSVSHHYELIEALRARDGTWARSVMQAHIRAGREVMAGVSSGKPPS